MQHFVFASPNTSDKSALNSISSLEKVCDGFYPVCLGGINELQILLNLIGIEEVGAEPLPNSEDFENVIDIAQYNLPEFTKEEFDIFYEKWIQATGRESNMDEYGQLVFLQGQSKTWNNRPSKVVLSEKP